PDASAARAWGRHSFFVYLEQDRQGFLDARRSRHSFASSRLILAFGQDDVRAAFGGRDLQVFDPAGFDAGFDGGLVWGVEAEGGVPVVRPGGEEADLAAVA